jgi:hypothetical protein
MSKALLGIVSINTRLNLFLEEKKSNKGLLKLFMIFLPLKARMIWGILPAKPRSQRIEPGWLYIGTWL